MSGRIVSRIHFNDPSAALECPQASWLFSRRSHSYGPAECCGIDTPGFCILSGSSIVSATQQTLHVRNPARQLTAAPWHTPVSPREDATLSPARGRMHTDKSLIPGRGGGI